MNFINKINKYLLENYPLIWNTRLVWMIGVNILVHILFFAIGFLSANQIQDLKEHHNLENFFFDSSAVYYNVLFSIFIILIWIIFYIRNNAFKNLYYLPKFFLFKQFCIIFLIFFISITQYFSFQKGLVTKIKLNYNWEEVDVDIKSFNKNALFLAQNQSDYEIKNKQYPSPFPLEVSYSDKLKNNIQENNNIDDNADYFLEENVSDFNIDITKPYIVKNKLFYQFYSINEALWLKDKAENPDRNWYSKNDFKYRIVKDVSQFKDLIHPSLLNYSKQLFISGQDSLAYKAQLKNHQELLESGDEAEIKKALTTFLGLTDKYKINHNLDVETWFKLVYNQPSYLLITLINQSPPNISGNFNDSKSRFYDDISFSERLYVSLGNTDNAFKNIHDAYFGKLQVGFIYFFIGFAYFLALFFFIFKTTSIKNVLLSIVAGIVVLVIIVWLMSSTSIFFKNSESRSYAIMLIISFLIIAFSIISYILKWKKISIYIMWSIGVFAPPIFILFSCLSYIRQLRLAHLDLYPKEYSYQSNFEIWFKSFGFFVVFITASITVFLYSIYIRKLKGRPE
tara:strand:+ start:22456 stop:24156 length:1701 start_codon:yes stop_codon:yes gene_type:complete